MSDTRDAQIVKAGLYNRLGLKIVEWASEFDDDNYYRLYPEGWRRLDEGATIACDKLDGEWYHENVKKLDEYSAELSTKKHLYSCRGILMAEAVSLFRKAASLEDPEAMWNLGWRYELGQGVAQSHEKATRHWSRAAQRGHQASIQKLAEG